MGIARYHALRRPASPRHLLLDVDIFNRPMRWADWLACMFFRRDEWFLVHVVGEDTLTGRTIEWTGRAVLIDGRSYLPEVPTLMSAVQWGIEAVAYGTALRFWQWREFARA